MHLGQIGTADAIGEGIIRIELLVALRRILGENAYIHLVLLNVSGGNVVDNNAGVVLDGTVRTAGNGNHSICTAGFRSDSEGAVILGIFLVKLKLVIGLGGFASGSDGFQFGSKLGRIEFALIHGILQGGHIGTGGNINRRNAVGTVVGFQFQAVIGADISFHDTDRIELTRSPTAQSGNIITEIQEKSAVSVVIGTGIDTGVFGQESFPVRPATRITAVGNQVMEPVIGINRITCLALGFCKPVIIIVSEILLIYIDHLIAVFIYLFREPGEMKVIVFSGTPEAHFSGIGVVADNNLFIVGFACTDTCHLIILDFRLNNKSPPFLGKGNDGRIVGSGLQDIFPGHNQHGEVQGNGAAVVVRDIRVVVVQLNGEGHFFPFRSVGERDLQFGLGLAVGKGDGAEVEDTLVGDSSRERNRNGAAGVGTGNGNAHGFIHFRVIGVAAHGILRGEEYAVAIAGIGRAGLIGSFLLSAGEHGQSANCACKNDIDILFHTCCRLISQ